MVEMTELVGRKRRDKPGYVLMILLTVVVLAATLVFVYLPQTDIDLFENDIGDLSDKYSLDVTPASWTFSIWIVIFAAQVAMVLYALTLTCRRNPLSTGKLYFDPPFLPPTFFGVYMLACVLTVTWVFAFDEEYLVAAMITLCSVALCLAICLAFAVKLLFQYEPELLKSELWLNVVFVHNALGLFVAWTSIASALNIGIVLRYVEEYSMETACWTALLIVLGLFLLFFCIDLLFCPVRMRYLFTPYLVLLVALVGVVEENYDTDQNYQILALAVLILAVLMLLVKLLVSVVRAIKTPSPLELDD